MAGARGKGMEARVCDNTCDTGEVERLGWEGRMPDNAGLAYYYKMFAF